ncbi:hypothetical protein [Chryseobacterium nematophagum]|nr:hypothetical protein [Chryseobacterium nematophagum]
MKNLFLILTLTINGCALSQVGINTVNPQATFHIDGAKDNPTTGIPSNTAQSNDFVVTQAGKVGINTITPTSTLSNEGSFQSAYKEVMASYELTDKDYFVTYTGNTVGDVITLPAAAGGTNSFTGRVYKIKNLSSHDLSIIPNGVDRIRTITNPLSTGYIVSSGRFVEFVNNSNSTGGVWDLASTTNTSTSNVSMSYYKLKLPPHASNGGITITNHNNPIYDTSDWHVISTESQNSSSVFPPSMIVTYEYQGTPLLSDSNVIAGVSNNTSYTDTFTANVSSINNNGTGGKTRVRVRFVRVDNIVNPWGAIFDVSLLFLHY